MKKNFTNVLLCIYLLLQVFNAFSRGAIIDVGNPGDELKQKFRFIKPYLAKKIRRIKICSFNNHVEDDIKSFILNHKDALSEDISRTPHIWSSNSDQEFCAYTHSEAKSPLRLSIEKCSENTTSRGAISRLLAHESVHHLVQTQLIDGIEYYGNYEIEEFADFVASAIVDSKTTINCPGDTNIEPLLESMGDNICHLKKDNVECFINKIYPVEFPRELKNPRNVAVNFEGACVSDDLGVTCGPQEKFPPIPDLSNVYGLWASEDSMCFQADFGLQCIGASQINLPFEENIYSIYPYTWGNTSKFVVHKDNSIQYYSKIRVNDTMERTVIEEFQNPSEIKSYYKHTCVIEEHGILCNDRSNRTFQRITNLDFPEQLTLNDRYGCTIDRNKVKCWKNAIVNTSIEAKTLNIPLENNSKIALKNNELCFTKQDKMHCIVLSF